MSTLFCYSEHSSIMIIKQTSASIFKTWKTPDIFFNNSLILLWSLLTPSTLPPHQLANTQNNKKLTNTKIRRLTRYLQQIFEYYHHYNLHSCWKKPSFWYYIYTVEYSWHFKSTHVSAYTVIKVLFFTVRDFPSPRFVIGPYGTRLHRTHVMVVLTRMHERGQTAAPCRWTFMYTRTINHVRSNLYTTDPFDGYAIHVAID